MAPSALVKPDQESSQRMHQAQALVISGEAEINLCLSDKAPKARSSAAYQRNLRPQTNRKSPRKALGKAHLPSACLREVSTRVLQVNTKSGRSGRNAVLAAGGGPPKLDHRTAQIARSNSKLLPISKIQSATKKVTINLVEGVEAVKAMA